MVLPPAKSSAKLGESVPSMSSYEKTRSTKRCVPAKVTTPPSVTGIRQYDSTGNTFLNLRFPPYLLPTQNTMAIIRKFDKTEWMSDFAYA